MFQKLKIHIQFTLATREERMNSVLDAILHGSFFDVMFVIDFCLCAIRGEIGPLSKLSRCFSNIQRRCNKYICHGLRRTLYRDNISISPNLGKYAYTQNHFFPVLKLC